MKKSKFKYVFKDGYYYHSKYLVGYFKRSNNEMNDIGIIVSKKVGNSVIRHKFTRKIREIYRLDIKNIINSYDIIIIAKKSILKATYKEIREDFLKLVKLVK